MLASDTEAVARDLADGVLAAHGFYAPMPRGVRALFARAAICEAHLHGIKTLTAIVGFVQAMVDMSPCFPTFEPFPGILARSDLSAEQ